MRSLVLVSALVAALTSAAAPSTPAPAPSARAAAVPPGHVYFWPAPNQTGPSGAWDYAPPGYREADPRVRRHAYSFDSHASVTVYAISYGSDGCLYRAIRPGDHSENWEWAQKFDGVGDTTMGCEPG
ncbi:hypothetical protein [Streptomyces gibsoniae]|uniref:Secreted protein n=1 Tax=Streptomyces gibsoniae TaxID=3075529 RepID=A0ABU2TVN2_9ACTN|nr:hypothetical protein [Streptomyces sp. DSM 41699]MDT0464979.1 hypothetical protein [Streptomyces sp. DSM 41699]